MGQKIWRIWLEDGRSGQMLIPTCHWIGRRYDKIHLGNDLLPAMEWRYEEHFRFRNSDYHSFPDEELAASCRAFNDGHHTYIDVALYMKGVKQWANDARNLRESRRILKEAQLFLRNKSRGLLESSSMQSEA